MKISDNIVFCNQTLQAHDIKFFDIFMFRVDMWRVTVTFFQSSLEKDQSATSGM